MTVVRSVDETQDGHWLRDHRWPVQIVCEPIVRLVCQDAGGQAASVHACVVVFDEGAQRGNNASQLRV